ncbi:MAG: rRNA cytosine-C5-methylase [Alistipes sp.]|nr:rRNA cytosine-C5-methylase [Alistipes sp.]
MVSLPEEFVESLSSHLAAEEVEALCRALDGVSPTSVRLNAAKCGKVDVSEPVPWCRGGYYLAKRRSFTLDVAFHAGAYYVQEAGSQFIDRVLQGESIEGCRILDMCAAPGGKTTIYSTAVGRQGLVVANEYVRSRANILADNVRKWGLGNVVVTNNDPSHIAAFEGWFDVVAVDAPCSGEGMFRKDEEARREWSLDNVRMCAARQMGILEEAWQALRGGGLLIYSTCTFNRRENEELIAAFEAQHEGELTASAEVAVDEAWGVVTGRCGAFQTFRFYPHRTASEGLFVAVARKDSGYGVRRTPKARKRVMNVVGRVEREELDRWVQPECKLRYAAVADTIYGYCAEQYDDVQALAESLTVIYSGVAMGQIFKGRLKPDWALSQYVGLRRGVVPEAEIDEEAAVEYLRRHDVASERCCEGLNLVVCRGFVLGFVKRVGARCNNLYPNSLKILK